MGRFDEAAAEFLALEKIAEQRLQWRAKGNQDWSQAGSRLIVEGRVDLYGRLILVAHKYRTPEKYSYSLMFRTHRVLALDVEPGHHHLNRSTLEHVRGTHWQTWPDMEAELDSRDFTWVQWLDAFLKRAHIRLAHPYRGPPFGVQRQLGLNDDQEH